MPEKSDGCVHDYGPVQIARFTGNPHRTCQCCGIISLDLEDDDDDHD